MKNSKTFQILDSLIADKIPQNLDLAPRILTKIQKQKGAVMNRRKKVLVPTAMVLVMMTVFTFTIPAVAETIQRWIGYIPGFGLVHSNKLRTLIDPQEQTINGVTLSVKEVIASSDKTLIKYSLTGVEDSMKTQGLVCQGNNSLPFNSSPLIGLSDGSNLQDISLGVLPDSGSYQFEATYSPIPPAEQNVKFSLDCLWQTGNESSLWSFQVPLQLTDKSEDELTIAPVVVVSTEMSQNVAEAMLEHSSFKRNLVVSQIIPLKDGYILQGSLTVDLEKGLTVDIFNGYLEDITILDANNGTLLTSMVPNDFVIEPNAIGNDKIDWAIQVNGTNIAWPLSITVNSIPAVTEPYPVSTFQVDVGENPQPNQEWAIEKDVPLGPKMVHVVSIKRVQTDFGMNGYELTFISDSDLVFSCDIAGGVPNGGGGQGRGIEGDPIKIIRSFNGKVPVGVLSVQLNGRGMESIQGPWQGILPEPVD